MHTDGGTIKPFILNYVTLALRTFVTRQSACQQGEEKETSGYYFDQVKKTFPLNNVHIPLAANQNL
jgi:hypothetical protein